MPSDAVTETTGPVDPGSIQELQELKGVIDEGETLLSQQQKIRDLIYTEKTDFFSLQPEETFPFGREWRDSDPLDRDRLRKEVIQYEAAASVLSGIALNSSDDPKEQQKSLSTVGKVLELYGSKLGTLNFYHGLTNINSLPGLDTDEEKKTLAKVLIARTICEPHKRDVFLGIFNIEKLTEMGVIAPSDIVEVQNIVMATVREVRGNCESDEEEKAIDVSDVVKWFKTLEQSEEGNPDQRGYKAMVGTEVGTTGKFFNRDVFKPLIVEPTTKNDDPHIGLAPNYTINGEATVRPKVALNLICREQI